MLVTFPALYQSLGQVCCASASALLNSKAPSLLLAARRLHTCVPALLPAAQKAAALPSGGTVAARNAASLSGSLESVVWQAVANRAAVTTTNNARQETMS